MAQKGKKRKAYIHLLLGKILNCWNVAGKLLKMDVTLAPPAGHTKTRMNKAFQWCPFYGGCASPALGAIQEPIPDFKFAEYINKTYCV